MNTDKGTDGSPAQGLSFVSDKKGLASPVLKGNGQDPQTSSKLVLASATNGSA